MAGWTQELTADDDGPAIAVRRQKQDTELDMTAMIDCTFLLLIFFTVAATLDPSTLVLPEASVGTGVDPDKCVIVTLAQVEDDGTAEIFLGDGTSTGALSGDDATQQAALVEYISAGNAQGKPNVMIKADRGVANRETKRVAEAAGKVPDVKIYYAVMEEG